MRKSPVRGLMTGLLLAFLCVAGANAQTTTVILVRHGEKAAEPAADPPLTDAGRARAQALLDAVKNAGVSIVYSTPTLRTMQTAEPLAKALGIEVTSTPTTGGAQAYAQRVADLIKAEARGKT